MEKHIPPKHLNPATKQWWQKVVESYELEPHHLKLLTLACEAWERTEEAREAIKKHGAIYTDRFGCPHSRPEISIERDSRLAFARLLRELNLDVDIPDDSRVPPLRY